MKQLFKPEAEVTLELSHKRIQFFQRPQELTEKGSTWRVGVQIGCVQQRRR